MSKFEQHAFLTGVLLLLWGAVLAAMNGTAGGSASLLGWLGLGTLGLCALSRAVRLYSAGSTYSDPLNRYTEVEVYGLPAK